MLAKALANPVSGCRSGGVVSLVALAFAQVTVLLLLRAGEETRTLNPLFTRQVRYRLRHASKRACSRLPGNQPHSLEEQPSGPVQRVGGARRRGELKGARAVHFKGLVAISRDIRERTNLTFGIGEQDLDQLILALESGEDQQAMQILEDVFGDAFGGSVALAIESLEFE